MLVRRTATGPVTVFIPALGLSALSTAGAVFHDAHADQALFAALEATLQPHVKLVRMETDINDPVFATAMAEQLHRSYRESVPDGPEARLPAC